VWQTQAPSKSIFFAWSTALCKILTMDNLRKRHIIVVDRCCLSKRDGESVDHLLLHCDVTFVLWITFLLGLVCLGLCLEEFSTYLPIGGSLEGQGVLQFGRWYLVCLEGKKS
jgi:hypothetical protein